MQEHQKRVEKFMRLAGQGVPLRPGIPSSPVRMLRAKLILEEALETIEALGFHARCLGQSDRIRIDDVVMDWSDKNGKAITPDLVGIADGCADISVVTIGTLSACGIDAQPIIEAIDESNLAKFTGDAHRREDGKWQKPTGWKAPDIAGILREQPPRAV